MPTSFWNVGIALENINTSYLSYSAKQTYNTLNGSIADSYKEALYSQAYSSYSSGDYQSAIPTFQKLVGMDEAYRDGSAAIEPLSVLYVCLAESLR